MEQVLADSLWVRVGTGRVFKIRRVDSRGVQAIGVLEMWRGPLGHFLEQFKRLPGDE